MSCAAIFESLYYLEASIAGVTYMDDFDFAQRYRDVNECNPFYWHPLHLPEECKQMFEKLIRSKLESLTPYRIFKEKQDPAEFVYSTYRLNTPVYTTEFVEPFHKIQTWSPFEILFELLRSDVRDLPSAPTLAASPYFGIMALYRQPVSYKSVNMIKKLSKAYADSGY